MAKKDNIQLDYGDAFRKLQADHGLTEADLATLLKPLPFHQSTIHRWITGATRPNPMTRMHLDKVLPKLLEASPDKISRWLRDKSKAA